MNNAAILYFPKKHFSSRFGEKFFTIDINECHNDDSNSYLCCNNQATYYNILISCGRDSWIVKRRYSEFVTLRLSILQAILSNNNSSSNSIDRMINKDTVKINTIDLPLLPPKTILSIINDENALEKRKKELDIFLDKLLSYLSSNNMIQLKCIRQFLGIIDNDETFHD
jgi:hypothetical protein